MDCSKIYGSELTSANISTSMASPPQATNSSQFTSQPAATSNNTESVRFWVTSEPGPRMYLLAMIDTNPPHSKNADTPKSHFFVINCVNSNRLSQISSGHFSKICCSGGRNANSCSFVIFSLSDNTIFMNLQTDSTKHLSIFLGGSAAIAKTDTMVRMEPNKSESNRI